MFIFTIPLISLKNVINDNTAIIIPPKILLCQAPCSFLAVFNAEEKSSS